jgi:hypothetical protein
MEATTGFFLKCQQYLSSRGHSSLNLSQYQVDEPPSNDNHEDEEEESALSSRFKFRAYQKVSTDDKSAK